MKKLLFALLVSGAAILAAGSPGSADCVQSWYTYYEYYGGPACGSVYYFCDGGYHQSGCMTSYYQYHPGCDCP